MANRRDTGVFKLENGCWAYRFTVKVDGVTITKRKTVDDSGQKFRTKTCAKLVCSSFFLMENETSIS